MGTHRKRRSVTGRLTLGLLTRQSGVRAAARSFFQALFRSETYLPHRNGWFVFGLLWGLPIPLTLAAHSPGWLYLLHPLGFAVVFGAIGTLVHDRERALEVTIQRLKALARTDALTGLHNRRAFDERLREEAERGLRSQQGVSLLMADIDHFKRLNDQHGHVVGDAVLRHIAERLMGGVRVYDAVCRYGGEEFAIILPGETLEVATATAERLRQAVAAKPFDAGEGIPLDVTVSLGVAAWDFSEPLSSWIIRADEALFEAKGDGRNLVRVAAAKP